MFKSVKVNGFDVKIQIVMGNYATLISEKCYSENFKKFKIGKTKQMLSS